MNLLDSWYKSIENGTSPHAVLLCGSYGQSKLDFARRAASLFIGGGLKENPNYLELNLLPVGELREIITSFILGAGFGARRCLVLNDAHLIKPHGQNALLKFIEEPPANTLILLVGIENGILPTIRSRCMILRCPSESAESISKKLCDEGVSPDTARLAANLSGGIASNAAYYVAEEYLKFRSTALNLIERTHFTAVPFAEFTALLTRTDEKNRKRVTAAALSELLDIWLSLLRDALLLGISPSSVLNTDCKALINKIAARFTISKISSMIDVILDAQRIQSFNTNPAMVLDGILAQGKG
ncbi:MAG: hypothetical protein Q4C01_08165 [Clostridia bacterium]|nr:hypothetical protein [Clostridia bacterium]